MKECRHCGRKIVWDRPLCPFCGKSLVGVPLLSLEQEEIADEDVAVLRPSENEGFGHDLDAPQAHGAPPLERAERTEMSREELEALIAQDALDATNETDKKSAP